MHYKIEPQTDIWPIQSDDLGAMFFLIEHEALKFKRKTSQKNKTKTKNKKTRLN